MKIVKKLESITETILKLEKSEKTNKYIFFLAIVISGFFVVFRGVITKNIIQKLNTFELYSMQACILTLCFHPLIIYLFYKFKLINLEKMTSMSVKQYLLIILCVFANFGIFLISVYLLKRHSLSKLITVQTVIQVALACTMGYFVLNERLATKDYIGIAMIAFGMILLTNI